MHTKIKKLMIHRSPAFFYWLPEQPSIPKTIQQFNNLLLIIFQCIRHQPLEVIDPGSIRGVGREELRRCSATALLGSHSLPEWNSLLRVISGHGHKDEAQVVGFGLLGAAIFKHTQL